MATRKRRTKAQLEAEQRAADQERIVAWADQHGAPISILSGWDPDTGTWANGSPIAQMLALIQGGNYLSTAAAAAGVKTIQQLVAKGAEYLVDAAEDRDYIDISVRPFVDLHRQIELAESLAEITLVQTVRNAAKNDPKYALSMLSRRFGQRWREQQAIFTGEETDERDAAVSQALTDPNFAMQLAALAHKLEDEAPSDDIDV